MSLIGEIHLVEGNDRKKIQELIPIRCIQQDCGQKEELTSIPASTQAFESDERTRVIINVCKDHLKLRQWTSKGQAQFTIRAREVSKELQPIKLQEYSIQLHKANEKLDNKVCCMRENLKMVNLKTIFTLLSLISNDDDKLKQLVKDLMIQQYFQYQQLRNEQAKALQNGNIISMLRHTHRFQTIRTSIYQPYGKILDTTQFFSEKVIKGKNGLSLSAISFVKQILPKEED